MKEQQTIKGNNKMIKLFADDAHGMSVTFECSDESMETWTEQLKLFFLFLRAQGFNIPEDWEEAGFEAMEQKKEEWMEEKQIIFKMPVF